MDVRKLLVYVGLLLLAAGLLFGLLPTSTTDGAASISCGSAWSPSRKTVSADKYLENLSRALSSDTGVYAESYRAKLCQDQLGSRGEWGAALGGLGSVTLLGLLFLVAVEQKSDKEAPLASP